MSSIYKELSYDQEIEVIRGIQFSVLGPEEILQQSVVEVTKTDTYNGNDPVINGLFDSRMGPLEHNRNCSTCESKNIFCPAHIGHIRLAKPVFHPMFFDTVRKFLKCVCFRCSRPFFSLKSNKPDIMEEIKRIKSIKNGKKRLDILSELTKKIKRCGDDQIDNEENTGCRAKQPTKYNKINSMKIVAEFKEIVKEGNDATNKITIKEMTAEEILRIFQRISDEDIELYGFNSRINRPDWMILTILVVPPPAVRPSIIEESGQRREDDLTHKLSDIIKYNNQLKERIESGKGTEEQIKNLTNLIQYHVATFMDNQIPGLPIAQQRNGRKLKSIADRLKKKEGRIRGNLNGKRVDQSARSVITPDPYIKLYELGIPLKIAMTVTFPEVVNKYNIDEIKKLIKNGPDNWPGAKYARLKSYDNITMTLKYANLEEIAEKLQFGDIIDRHLRDGDYVLFNRQPSLHKMSMMTFKAKIMKYQTFRLPVTTTGPFNADFDGDEMNLFAPQNEQTMSELLDLALVPYLIITPRDGKPIVELVQDTMLGSYRITKDWVTIQDKPMANLQMVNSYFNGMMPNPVDEVKHLYSGKQAFSQIFPPGLFIDTKNDLDEKFIINNSIIEKGTIDKSIFHSMSRGILSVLFHDYSPFEAQRFLDNTQRLICRWLVYGGFSVGISDLITDKETTDSIKKTITKYKTDAYLKIENVRKGILDNKSIFKNQDFFELEILNILNQLMKEVGNTATKKIDDKTNRMINMIKSKAKGKKDNVAQMVGCLGQQNVDGKRVAYGFTDRTLPHYTKYDDGPEARGFVENSFISGLSPQEVFFHAMGGREGLIDTAVKSVTGDTEIIIIENGEAKSVQIGKWIDSYLDNVDNLPKIEFSKVANQELLTLSNKVYIPTCDEKGKVTWGELTAITRHDPGERLYKFKTLGGRSGIAADSKTLLIWDEKLKEFHKMESKEVKEGMYIPVTAELPEPPIIINEIDMSIYFPKDEYIHGTEFNKAISMMNEAMKGRIQIPRGWWEEHNGKSFITPYTKKASLTRVTSGRSNTENIHDECIYPYHASRDTCRIPAKFKLDYDNGRFVGLFLADGHADLHSGQVIITKKDEDVIAFVKAWFDKYAIKSKTKTDKKTLGETTTTSGYSTLLTIFMTKLVGHGSENKYIPDIAYTAPIEFVKGLISGYFSGDGYINAVDKKIEIGSVSRNLIEGISLLCSRIDVFGKISITQQKSNNIGTENILPMHHISIRAQWARNFRDNIDLIQKYKNNALKEINSINLHRNFPYQNNVVLDKIVEINQITSSNYKKLYDVTVPSTLNFQTRNGVSFRDTSETGYIQRRLVKAMEDAKIYPDQTVRNAAGSIVQYLYGEDGIDGTKIENQYIPYISMSLVEMNAKYYLRPKDPINIYLTEEAISKLSSESDWIEKAKKHYEHLIDDRDFLINIVFKKEKVEKIQYAIPFDRIITNSLKRLRSMGSTAVQTDLTPKYILDKIDELINNLVIIRPNQGSRFLHILLRVNLSPKVLIFEKNISKPVFDWIISEIERYFIQSIACASEMVGIIAAQSIGEISTQQTLDSFHASGTAAAVKATSGVPRLKELLSVSKNIKTPALIIYLKKDIGSVINPIEDADGNINDERVLNTKMQCIKIMQQLEITRLKDILESTEIYWDPPTTNGLNTGISDDTKVLEVYKLFSELDVRARSQNPWVLRMKLNKKQMHNLGLSMMDIFIKIDMTYHQTVDCIFTDDNANELIFRVRMTDESSKDIYPDDAVAALKAIEFNLVNNVLLKGTKGIKKTSMRLKTRNEYDKTTDKFNKITEWVIDTDGTNLQELLANPNIDQVRTRSNDINEIYKTLGIEAARNALYEEFIEIFQSEDAVNYRHMSLLLDTMANKGMLMSIDRHGINRGDVGPLAKSSFEETTDMLINASVFGENDKVNGVSANIMLGQMPPCGTGDTEVILDEDYFLTLMKEMGKDKNTDIIEEYGDISPQSWEKQTSCSAEALSLEFTPPKIIKKKAMKLPDPKITFK